jgi:predicted ester cyclase
VVVHGWQWKLLMLVIALLTFAGGVSAQEDESAREAANREAVMAWLAALNDPQAAVGEPAVVTDDDPLKDHLLSLESAFPDFTLEVDEMIVDGDDVAVRLTFHGVQRGEFNGIPPTGHTVDVPVALFMHLDQGQVVERWMQGDVLLLMTQLESALLYNSLAVSSDQRSLCGSLLSVKNNP